MMRPPHFRPCPGYALPRLGAMVLATGLALSALPLSAIAQTYHPPDVGLPGRREGGGTRGGCAATDQTLLALVPADNFGYTLEDYPTLYWYIPEIEAETAELVLLNENNDEIYQATFPLPDQAGVISVALPTQSDLPPLAVGQSYHWFFSIICDPDDRSGDLFTDGWIQRTAIPPDSSLAMRLRTASPETKAAIYAEAGIWFDALETLATDRSKTPDNPQVERQWATLLESVGLTDLIDQPFTLAIDGNSLVVPDLDDPTPTNPESP